jgi:hypothetical protein
MDRVKELADPDRFDEAGTFYKPGKKITFEFFWITMDLSVDC